MLYLWYCLKCKKRAVFDAFPSLDKARFAEVAWGTYTCRSLIEVPSEEGVYAIEQVTQPHDWIFLGKRAPQIPLFPENLGVTTL